MRLPVLFHIDQKLGAWQVGSSTQRAPVAFKLFFPAGFDPQISGTRVAGDFQHLIIALNFSEQEQQATIPFSENGLWTDLLSGWAPMVNNFHLQVTIGSNWGHVFCR